MNNLKIKVMEENTFWDYFLGTNDVSFHLAGLLLCLIGTIIAKWHFYKLHEKKMEALDHKDPFSLSYWISDNWISVLLSMAASFILVRFVDVILGWANNKFSLDIPQTTDQIFYYVVAAVAIQYWMHTKYK